MKRLNWTCRIFCVSVILLIASAASAESRYTITDLGSAKQGTPQALNNSGQILLLVDHQLVLWQDGVTTNLEIQGTGLSFNDHSQVVGTQMETGKFSTAFLWENGQLTDLGALVGATESRGIFINNTGQILLMVYWKPGDSGFLLWDNGQSTNLNETIPGLTYVTGMNDFGVVTGYRTVDGHLKAFSWTADQLTDWEPANPTDSLIPCFINNSGKIIGTINSASGFLGVDGQIQEIGAISGTDGSYPTCINNYDQIVGCSTKKTIYNTVLAHDEASLSKDFIYIPSSPPFLWENGSITNLNDFIDTNSGWTLVQAKCINDHGQIVGTGKLNGDDHGYLLTPIQREGIDAEPLAWLRQLGCMPAILVLAGALSLTFNCLGTARYAKPK